MTFSSEDALHHSAAVLAAIAIADAMARHTQRFVESVRRERLRTRTVRELNRLGDYQLRDIGLRRDDIGSVVESLVKD